jgi:chemotaxis protein CheX
MSIGLPEVYQVVDIVWQSVGIHVEVTSDRLNLKEPNQYLTGCTRISGAWTGMILMDCPEELARQAAATMFQLDYAAVQEDDVYDALSELTNMVGGNLKGLLPGPSKLLLPAIVRLADQAIRVRNMSPSLRSRFKHQNHVLEVGVFPHLEKIPMTVGWSWSRDTIRPF